jgi:hypothetical protein
MIKSTAAALYYLAGGSLPFIFQDYETKQYWLERAREFFREVVNATKSH